MINRYPHRWKKEKAAGAPGWEAAACEEAIRYGMSTIRVSGKNLVHMAVQKNHIGFYPAPSGVAAFEAEIAKRYRYSKGAIQFPIGAPLPIALITKIVRFRLKEERARLKK